MGSCSFTTSEPFKFIVEDQAHFVHAGLVVQVSGSLDHMMNGNMVEAQQGFAVLDDTDKATFIRFTEWLYKGFYTAAPHSKDTRSVEWPLNKEAEEQDHERALKMTADSSASVQGTTRNMQPSDSANAKNFKEQNDTVAPSAVSLESKSYRKQELKHSFLHRKHNVRQESIRISPPRPNQSPDEDYSGVFLSHARLYVFADKYYIKELRTLAFENLQATLSVFNLYAERTIDVVQLLRYIYANTLPTRTEENLRSLMSHYIAFEMDTLMSDEGFKALMIEDGGDLLTSYMEMVGKRLRND